MSDLVLIRHGPTDWNEAGRIQGHSDISLSAAGRTALVGSTLPFKKPMNWIVSPLKRAKQTASFLGGKSFRVERRLIEMNWGAWEGKTVEELRAELGEQMQENEDQGLDFRPEGGESPREVMDRLASLFTDLAKSRRGTIAVTHKGVIRAALCLATGWDMMGKPPVKLNWAAAHLFSLNADGKIKLSKANISMNRTEDRAAAP